MKRFMVILTLTLLLAAPALAQPYGTLWLVPATDIGYDVTCLFNDDEAKDLCEVAVVLNAFGSFVGLDGFRVETTQVPWTHLGDFTDYTLIGSTPTGASVSFGACISTPIHVMTILYFCPGTPACGQVFLLPTQFDITAVKCDNSTQNVGGSPLTVNGILDVPPGGFDPDCFCPALPTQNSTWGSIKALFE
jgi:hypothetical protein